MILEARRVLFLPLTLFVSILAACASPEMPAPADGQSVSIMAFNVENLFDNVDDPGRNDAALRRRLRGGRDVHHRIGGGRRCRILGRA